VSVSTKETESEITGFLITFFAGSVSAGADMPESVRAGIVSAGIVNNC
jgi:hypothetical protein